MKKVYISGGMRFGEPKLVAAYGWTVVDKIDDAHVAMFTGGADINPAIYNQPPHHTTSFDVHRDAREILDYQKALALGLGIFGICRGAQFLCAMAGGSLIQDCTQHCNSHDVKLEDGEAFSVTSCHHQMMVPPEDAVILATSPMKCSVSVWDSARGVFVGKDATDTPEIVAFPKIKAIGVQGHPEFDQHREEYQRFRDYSMALMEGLIVA